MKRVGGKIDLNVRDIKIPNAQGNTPNAYVDVGDDEGGRLRLVYLAFERVALNTKDEKMLFDYPLGLEDRAEIAEFIEPLKFKSLRKLCKKYCLGQKAAITSLIKNMTADGSKNCRMRIAERYSKELTNIRF